MGTCTLIKYLERVRRMCAIRNKQSYCSETLKSLEKYRDLL